MIRHWPAVIVLALAPAAPAAPPDPRGVYATVGGAVGGHPAWEASLILDPALIPEADPYEHRMVAAGLVHGWLVDDARAATYDEVELVLIQFASAHGIPVPMLEATLGYGVRRAAGGRPTGRQLTLAMGAVPASFLLPFARRVVDDGRPAAWHYGVFLKAPLPLPSALLRW